jgi:oligopeptide transport system ATP-binding protein
MAIKDHLEEELKMGESKNAVFEVKNVKKYFNLAHKNVLKAVDDVSFTIKEGETLGLVGESGCGKTTCGRTVIGMYDRTEGEILYKGKEISKLKGKERKAYNKDVQIIFQDPYASLNPRMTVADIIAEGIDIHGLAKDATDRRNRVNHLLELVGLDKEHGNRFIHEFSGGQRQRIGIARALAVEPKFILCDEPISALDVSIQAQIANLLIKFQKELGLTYLFIAHDLAMVKHISDRVAVMYLGAIVELDESEDLYKNPLHPYTKALMSAIPIADPKIERGRQRIMLEGDVPSPINTPIGCKFQGRCPYCIEQCKTETPQLREVSKGHFVACHLVK